MSAFFALYPEDKSGTAAATQRLVQHLVLCVEPAAHHHVAIETPHGEVLAACLGQAWRGGKQRHEVLQRQLVRDLVVRLKRGQWVVFHYDADVPWGESPKMQSAVEQLFDKVYPHGGQNLSARVLFLVPHYSVEAWLYLNEDHVKSLVGSGKERRDSLAWLSEKQSDDGGFDHINKPKGSPLGDRLNGDLAEERWPRKQAASRSPSWKAAVDAWSAKPQLRSALRETGSGPA